MKKLRCIAIMVLLSVIITSCGDKTDTDSNKTQSTSFEDESLSEESREDSVTDETEEGTTASDDETDTDSDTGSDSDSETEATTASGSNNSNSTQTTTTTTNSATSAQSTTTTTAASNAGTSTGTVSHVTVHDPSIVEGTDKNGKKCYFIFGSHLDFAYSYDLQHWTKFKNNINTNYNTLFADAFDWASRGDSAYATSGNMWAPDVIYNKSMGKWCMYMSINGCSWNSVIVMLTADNLMGNWTYVGPVIYSGFTAAGTTRTYEDTDYVLATGDTNFSNAARYTTSSYTCYDGSTACEATTWSWYYGAHAIDPCVFYDASGNLWMSYGSWSGGIYLIRLSNSTGLRDYSVTYADCGSDASKSNFTDPYMGYHIAGGYGATGEASYIVYDAQAGYYYLYVSYYSLTREGGYQIRMFRSTSVTGTYVDADGTRAAARGSSRDVIGVKILGNYYFSSLSSGSGNYINGYMAGGHNSAFIDSSGNRYIVYHTRFNCGQEWHEVRVHQQFVNEDGWLVTAVYEYRGDSISTTGYSSDLMCGTYEMVDMGLSNDGSSVIQPVSVTLNSNGTITGSVSGTWTYTQNTPYVTIVIEGNTYKGVFFYQQCESTAHEFRMTFTVLGDNDKCLWGSK